MEGFGGEFAQDRIAIVGVDGGVHERAAAGDRRGSLREMLDEATELLKRAGDLVEVGGADFPDLVEGETEGFGGELFLAAEVAVDSAFLQAGGVHELLQGGALVAVLIEDRRGCGDDALACGFSFAHWKSSRPA